MDFAPAAGQRGRAVSGPTRDQLLRASRSVALNIAEGCGTIPTADRGRFLQIAGGSARECGAILDILGRCGVLDHEGARKHKELLVRIVAMLTRMIERGIQVREEDIVYGYVNDNGNEEPSGQEGQTTRNSSRLTLDVGRIRKREETEMSP